MLTLSTRWIILSTFFFAPLNIFAQGTSQVHAPISNDSLFFPISPDFKQMYVVFAGPYPSSPSSAFGHLLIIFEPNSNTNISPQLWNAVNFAAAVENYSSPTVLINGLIGRLKGSFESISFYEKIREYSYIDSRDLWLFPIELNKAEKVKIIEYLNDNKEPKRYRFTDNNCATQVAQLILYALGKEYKKQFFGLPQDILEHEEIKKRIGQPLLIQNIEEQVKDITATSDIDELMNQDGDSITINKKVKLLKTMEWLYFNDFRDLTHEQRKLIQNLRLEISSTPSSYTFEDLRPTPFNLHYPARLSINYRNSYTRMDVLDLNFRMGLHDFEDFQSVYPKYDFLNFLNIKSSINNRSFLVNEFWLLNQRSRYPRNKIFSYPSWDLALGVKRYTKQTDDILAYGIFSGIGKTYDILPKKWVGSIILGLNLVHLNTKKLEAIINPSFESYFYINDTMRYKLELSNSSFLWSNSMYNPELSSTFIYNIGINSVIKSTVNFDGKNFEILAGFNLNIPI